MNAKEIRYAFKTVFTEVSQLRCENLHHPLKHQHKAGEHCPAEYHVYRQIHVVQEWLKDKL